MDLTKYHYTYNAAAYFAVAERFPDINLVEVLSANKETTFDLVCFMLAKCSEQGELVRRYMGHEPGDILTEEELRMKLRFTEVSAARQLCFNAIVKGMQSEQQPDEEYDETLAEFQKKTGTD